ncbi:hypothetical protein CRH09_11745 [Nocardia terpenica]|uniref:Uncharacterized protein n=1 Tax=Nocardia terpenica TaxID=455432 RepID=A0A291RHJ0_9NOCA|nr:hypothetical protein CRH09_11745 [Nocardia terpenica]
MPSRLRPDDSLISPILRPSVTLTSPNLDRPGMSLTFRSPQLSTHFRTGASPASLAAPSQGMRVPSVIAPAIAEAVMPGTSGAQKLAGLVAMASGTALGSSFLARVIAPASSASAAAGAILSISVLASAIFCPHFASAPSRVVARPGRRASWTPASELGSSMLCTLQSSLTVTGALT